MRPKKDYLGRTSMNFEIPLKAQIFMHWFLATDPEARVRFPALPEKKVVGLERGPISLVSTN
jgi:hypothetical protein